MTPDALAHLHGSCFTFPRPWSAKEFAGLLASDFCDLVSAEAGFALIRTIAGESELLTIAVAPEARRQGLGRAVLGQAVQAARAKGADEMFLEVAADNRPAIWLYESSGFSAVGRRAGYYRQPDGHRVDAVLMARAI